MNCVMADRMPGFGDDALGSGARGSTFCGSTVCSVIAIFEKDCPVPSSKTSLRTQLGAVLGRSFNLAEAVI